MKYYVTLRLLLIEAVCFFKVCNRSRRRERSKSIVLIILSDMYPPIVFFEEYVFSIRTWLGILPFFSLFPLLRLVSPILPLTLLVFALPSAALSLFDLRFPF